MIEPNFHGAFLRQDSPAKGRMAPGRIVVQEDGSEQLLLLSNVTNSIIKVSIKITGRKVRSTRSPFREFMVRVRATFANGDTDSGELIWSREGNKNRLEDARRNFGKNRINI